MQAFSVAVIACLPTLGRVRDEIHKALAALHIQNSWYAAGPGEVLQVASGFFDASPRLPTTEGKLENLAASQPKPQMPAATQENAKYEAVANVLAHTLNESAACPILAATPNATQESPQYIETDELESRNEQQGNDESDAASKDSRDTSALLVPCAKCDAGSAHSITEALRKKLRQEAAAALLKQYKQAVMRDSEGRNMRYWVDGAGATVKLADGVADSAAAEKWQPNLAFEQAYDDLSDASSLDGNESPVHRQVKEYAQARRVARAMEGAFC
jgi:hypothetical protein